LAHRSASTERGLIGRENAIAASPYVYAGDVLQRSAARSAARTRRVSVANIAISLSASTERGPIGRE